MFIFRSLPRSDRPVLSDPVRAELDRRILFAPPGPLYPIPTYEQVRAELEGRRPPLARALTLAEADPLPPALAVLAQLLDDDVERVEAGLQQPSEGAEAECFRDHVEARLGTENGEKPIKQESYGLEPAYTVEKAEVHPGPATEKVLNSPSLGTVPLKVSVNSERQRAHKNDVPWPKKRFVQGHKVSKTLSKKEREWIDDALLRLKVLLGTGALVCVTMKPVHLDALGPVERMRYWKPFVNKFRSYRKRRCQALKKKLSWWVVRCVWVRESDPDDDLGEHFHWILVCPNAEEADRFIAHVQDTSDYEGWGDNTHAMRIDAEERMVGGKLSSFFNYVLKACHPQSRFADHTIGWKPSGALVGRRYFITNNLKSADVIAETEVGLETLKRVRKEKKRAAFVRRAQEKARQERLYPYDAAPADPVLDPAAVEPKPIEPATFLTPGSAAHIHQGAEQRGMAEIDIQPAASAAHEPAINVPAMVEAHAEAVELVEDVTPAASAPIEVAPAFATAVIVPDVAAEPGPPSSSPNTVLAALAGVGRSMASAAAAGVGWVASRLGSRSPPPLASPVPSSTATSSPVRRPRAPLFHPSTIPSAGAFFGAPMLW